MLNSSTDSHAQAVKEWFELNASGLSPAQQIHLLEQGILAIEGRACAVLSSVTMMVIMDRVLYQTQQKFPILPRATLQQHLLETTLVEKDQHAEEIVAALTYLLVELLGVLGRITADILTMPLHIELKRVTVNDSEGS
jgi:hypothetical protein